MLWLLSLLLLLLGPTARPAPANRFFAGNDSHLRYTGRFDKTTAAKPRGWAPGVYLTARFQGPSCTVHLADEMPGGNHNYVEVVVDGQSKRYKLTAARTALVVAQGLGPGPHTLLVCKDTEAGQGYLQVEGLTCAKLLPPPARPAHRIEFIGNSITCGYGADTSQTRCHRGQWYDQHNAYMAYGPRTARALGAEWQLTAESGIGLMHSCCNKPNTMPQEFGTVDLRVGGLAWDTRRYQPDLVTICLGQNDGVQDSVQFCGAYVAFLKTLRASYPRAQFVCLTSPMADARLTAVLRRYLLGVEAAVRASGDTRVGHFFFAHRYIGGCDAHPSLAEQGQIADELTAYLKQEMRW
jgi:hypothetical protein